MRRLVASESVAIGHPDKLADQISDAILDAYLGQDPLARVDCSCVACQNRLFIVGEISSSAHVDCEQIARQVAVDIGYTSEKIGLNGASCQVDVHLKAQSRDISQAVSRGAGV